MWLFGSIGFSLVGFLGAVIHLIIAVMMLMFAGNVIKGLKVKDFVLTLIYAVVIGVVSWLIDGIIGLSFSGILL